MKLLRSSFLFFLSLLSNWFFFFSISNSFHSLRFCPFSFLSFLGLSRCIDVATPVNQFEKCCFFLFFLYHPRVTDDSFSVSRPRLFFFVFNWTLESVRSGGEFRLSIEKKGKT
jgi:hypothetical protein